MEQSPFREDNFGSAGQNIVVRMRRLYKTGIGLTTGFIGSHTTTHNCSVFYFITHNN
jgi:hypothetical protein